MSSHSAEEIASRCLDSFEVLMRTGLLSASSVAARLGMDGQDLDEVLAVLGKSLLEVQQLVEELACQPGEVREGTEASYELDIVGKAGAAGLEAGLLEQEPVLPSLAAGGSGSRVPAGSQPPPRLTKKQREIIELGLRLHRDSFVALYAKLKSAGVLPEEM